VSLEDEFWHAFREIARERGMSINRMAETIDDQRGTGSGLAGAIRLFVLNHYRNKHD